MSFDQRVWSPTGSTLRPIIFVLRFSNSGISPAMWPSSVVQTGVKSLGWENRTAQESPIQSWKLIGPSVVSAWKSGAVSLIESAIRSSFSEVRRLNYGGRPRGRDYFNHARVALA